METITAKVISVGPDVPFSYKNQTTQLEEQGHSREVVLTTFVPGYSEQQGCYPRYEQICVELRGNEAINCQLVAGQWLVGVIEHSATPRRDVTGWFGRTLMRRYAILERDAFDAIRIYP